MLILLPPLDDSLSPHLSPHSLSSSLCSLLFSSSQRSPDGIEFLDHLNLGRVLSSGFDPLSRCLSSVGREFLRVVWTLDLVTSQELRHSKVVRPFAEDLGISRLSILSDVMEEEEEEEEGGGGGGGGKGGEERGTRPKGQSGKEEEEDLFGLESVELGSFFPFDPYLLQSSSA